MINSILKFLQGWVKQYGHVDSFNKTHRDHGQQCRITTMTTINWQYLINHQIAIISYNQVR